MASTCRIIPDNINYGEMKINYLNMVLKYKNVITDTCSTKESIEETIKRCTTDPGAAKNLRVYTVDDKKKLFIMKENDVLLEMVAVEDAFDILLDAHLASDHGDEKETFMHIKKVYSVLELAARWIVESCNVCKSSNKINKSTFIMTEPVKKRSNPPVTHSRTRGVWRINILKDDSSVNKPHRSSLLLILKEDTTNFLILRPLYEKSEGLALELVKIFTEFGYPEKVYVANLMPFYEKIFHLVYLINPADEIPVEQVNSRYLSIFEQDKLEVETEIRNWIKAKDDIYWEQSCHIVQYKLNTKEKLFTRLRNTEPFIGIPFKEFFEHDYRTVVL